MLFKPELIDLIQQGAKTQTRRVMKDHEELIGFMPGTRFSHCVAQTLTIDERVVPRRIKWQVGRTYATCPGRGKKGVGHITINRLHCEADVRFINFSDAQAEGFEDVRAFLSTWMAINDRQAQACWEPETQRWIWYAGRQWHNSRTEDFVPYLMSRPGERYHAFVIDFEWMGK